MPQAERVCRELLQRDILVDWRPNAGVRMSPHFYTADDELETAMEAAEEIVNRGEGAGSERTRPTDERTGPRRTRPAKVAGPAAS